MQKGVPATEIQLVHQAQQGYGHLRSAYSEKGDLHPTRK